MEGRGRRNHQGRFERTRIVDNLVKARIRRDRGRGEGDKESNNNTKLDIRLKHTHERERERLIAKLIFIKRGFTMR